MLSCVDWWFWGETIFYFENIFTIQRIRYNPNPTPKINTPTTNAIRIAVTLQPNLPLSHSDTPKIIILNFEI